MKYSFILAGLAVSAIATPYVDIVVGEGGVTTPRHNHHHEHNRHHRGWFSSLLGRSRSHSHSRGNRRHNHQNDHHRHRALWLVDDDGMVGEHYECILTAHHNSDERENTKSCCNQQGGELYESRGHCIFRDTMGDPQEEWQACGMNARGTNFAACYPRDQQEIDDELAGRGWHNDEEHRNRHSRHGRSRSHGRHSRNHHGGRMTVFDNDDDDNDDDNNGGRHGKHGRKHHKKQEIFECRIDMDDDNRRQQLLQQCCEEDVGGHLDMDSQTCWNVRKSDRMEFENCAIAQGAQNAECYKPNDGDNNGGDGDNNGDDDRDHDRY